MSSPVFRDPLFNGAADPTVILDVETSAWWMFYTQRRTTDPGPGFRWVHGSRIGVAISTDDGTTWEHRGTARGLGHADGTLWAPEVVCVGGEYRMYVSVVAGVPYSWEGEAHIEEYASADLLEWRFVRRLDLGSDRVIDAAVARCGDGAWRLWYKNERDRSTTWAARSTDLVAWTVEGQVIGLPAHEGPNVFRLGGWYWMLTDEWRGQAVHRSSDGVTWERQAVDDGLVLNRPGRSAFDSDVARHADVVVHSDPTAGGAERAAAFYFTHTGEAITGLGPGDCTGRTSAVHMAAVTAVDGVLLADRDIDGGQGLRRPLSDTTAREGAVRGG